MTVKESEYFVVNNGKPMGPYRFQELLEMKLQSSDFVRSEEMKDFKELREIPTLSEVLGVQYEPTLPQYFASMDLRLLAWAIDVLIAFAIFCVFVFLPILFFSSKENGMQFTLIGLLSVFPIHFTLNVVMESSSRQGSFGKNILNIKVCDLRGMRISIGRSFLRNSYKILGFISLGLGFFMGFFDRKQRCWHDKLAQTFVIKDRLTN